MSKASPRSRKNSSAETRNSCVIADRSGGGAPVGAPPLLSLLSRYWTVNDLVMVACELSPTYTSICPGSTMNFPKLS
jgi:hypothetical protein